MNVKKTPLIYINLNHAFYKLCFLSSCVREGILGGKLGGKFTKYTSPKYLDNHNCQSVQIFYCD